ncbi:flagellar motor protein [Nocardioides sp. LHG3406-4]|uniref:flagellar motor protein n=1 Tax=Nocardioides sp. LHG3406-4 TaxID=2804575 RepID=UPI003CEA6EC6
MDPASAVGIGLAFVVIIVSNMLEGGNPMSLMLLPPLLLVFGTTLLISMAGSTIPDTKRSMAALKTAFTSKVPPAHEVVPTVVALADKARREGLLALEEMTAEIDDPFLVRGVSMAIDGTDPEEVREILESSVYAKRAADKQAAKFFADAGAYAPTIGIIGTVMGLVHVLENLAQPEELGHLIAAAFIATLWGVMSANVLWLPIASRLKRLSELEVTRMELVIEGVAAIQSGSNPRVVAAKLYSLLPEGAEDQAGKSAAKKAA